MKLSETALSGVYLISPDPYIDHRGLLRRHYCSRVMNEHGIEFLIRQTNISENTDVFTLRGFHFQLKPHQESKQITCVRGSIFGVVLDMRAESKTYKQWIHYECNGENRLSVIVPEGCASAYLTLEPDTWILYYHSQYYQPGYEWGIRYNDPQFLFEWPVEPAVISTKDANYADFDDAVFSETEI